MTATSLYRRNKKEALKGKYQDSNAWRHFTDRICASTEIKRALHERQAGCCAFCNVVIVSRSLAGCTVHHVSYDHRCTFSGNAAPSPDCGVCLRVAPRKAETCLTHVRLLHTACHDTLHQAEQRDPVWRRAMGLDV